MTDPGNASEFSSRSNLCLDFGDNLKQLCILGYVDGPLLSAALLLCFLICVGLTVRLVPRIPTSIAKGGPGRFGLPVTIQVLHEATTVEARPVQKTPTVNTAFGGAGGGEAQGCLET